MLQTLSFSGHRLVNMAATFFRYESGNAGGADESVRVRADGNDLGMFQPGDSFELPAQAINWEITPEVQQCTGVIRLGLGRVQSARLAGMVRVVDEITDAITTIADSLPVDEIGWQAAEIVAPWKNKRGLIIRNSMCDVTAGPVNGYVDMRMVACKTRPTGYSAPSQQLPFCAVGASPGEREKKDTGLINKLLPPGFGIYAARNVVGSHAERVTYQLTFELL